jgi:hypothetical protein
MAKVQKQTHYSASPSNGPEAAEGPFEGTIHDVESAETNPPGASRAVVLSPRRTSNTTIPKVQKQTQKMPELVIF